jgi:hypothetical protein
MSIVGWTASQALEKAVSATERIGGKGTTRETDRRNAKTALGFLKMASDDLGTIRANERVVNVRILGVGTKP